MPSPYKPIPKHLQKKRGKKPGLYGNEVKKRLGKLVGIQTSDVGSQFYDSAQLILMEQMARLTEKSCINRLDPNDIKMLDVMIKAQLVLDSKQQDLPQDVSPKMVERALTMLSGKKQKPTIEETEEPNEPSTENPETTTKD